MPFDPHRDSAADANWRREKPILVPEAHAVAALGAIRSLGRAGYPVHALSVIKDGIGLRSRYAVAGVVAPPYSSAEFGPWVLDYVKTHSIAGIVPLAVFGAEPSVFERLAPLMPIPRDPGVLARNLTKYGVSKHLMSADDATVRDNLPPTLLIERENGLPDLATIAGLPAPYFIKADGQFSASRAGSQLVKAGDAAAARDQVAKLAEDYSHFIVQGYVPGMGAAAAFIVWNGTVVADFLNLCVHEVDGFCTLRESWRHEAMHADALRKIRSLGWEGVSMLEYRWDPTTDKFHLIELNPRFWAALHTALYAGSDLPRYLFDAFFGRDGSYKGDYALGVRARLTFPYEIGYVLSRLRNADLSAFAKLWSVVEFFLLFGDPRVRADMFFPRDRGLYFRSLARTLRGFVQRPAE
jgi:hypothetical protein